MNARKYLVTFCKVFGTFSLLTLILGGIVWYANNVPPMDPEFEATLVKSNFAAVQSSSVRLLVITGIGRSSEDAAVDARKKIGAAINSGKYNIAAVETTYGLNGNIESAAIAYYANSVGSGNNIRVKFIDGGRFPSGWAAIAKKAEARLQAQLKEIECSGKYNIVRIRPEISGGYLYAAEVYYAAKNSANIAPNTKA